MQAELDQITQEALIACQNAQNLQAIEQVKVDYLGKKSRLIELLKQLGKLSAEERPRAGELINKVKQTLQTAFNARTEMLETEALNHKLLTEKIDVTLKGRGQDLGSLHPVTRVRERIEMLFTQLGFEIAEGPEIEDEKHNFEDLNIPAHHPSREMSDTFYFPNGLLLRTHTSNVQIREMKNRKPPFKMIAPGRVYRSDSDVTHTPMFHQVEGIVVDENTNFAELKGLLDDFLKNFYEQPNLNTRFRPSYFPFTEPSAEVDIQCGLCAGAGCRVCKNTGWLEVLGCGMIHPNVLKSAGIDSERYTGFAFGIGMDRLAMRRYGIPDLRMLFENDIRFLEKF